MKAYLPPKFLQVAKHQSNSSRLEEFRNLLEQIGLVPDMETEIEDLDEVGILILPTRQKMYPFCRDGELARIKAFVSDGNPLFHLSNHGKKPNTTLEDLTVEDSKIGNLFGYHFYGYVEGPENTFSIFTLENSLNLFGIQEDQQKFSVCNSCSLRQSDSFTVIADYSKSVISYGDKNSVFGIAKPHNPALGTGAIVALGDSGILGKPMDGNPGPGLNVGDNRELITQIIKWLIKEAS